MLKKLTYLFLVLALMVTVLPAMGQSDAVVERLEEYNSDLPAGFGVLDADALTVALIENPDLVLLDVRETPELEGGYIEGSIHIPVREIPANLDLLPDLDAEIVVVCQGGARAMLAQSALNLLGYDNAKTLKGGFGAWAGEDYPVTTDPLPEFEAGEAPEFDADVFEAVDAYLSNLPEGFGFVRAGGLAAELIEEDITLIDVRTQDEWDNVGYIEGASLVPIQDFMSMQSMWPEDKDTPIVVYCASSYRGGMAKTMMELMGYTDVRNLIGGINAWLAEGLPVEGGAE